MENAQIQRLGTAEAICEQSQILVLCRTPRNETMESHSTGEINSCAKG